MLLVQSAAYRQEFGFDASNVMLVNLYGPRDNFDPGTSHVDPGAHQESASRPPSGARARSRCGARGRPRASSSTSRTRPQALVKAFELLDDSDPVNIGSGREISIHDLALMIARLCGFQGRLRWDASKPDGQPRRCLDTSKAVVRLGLAREHAVRDPGSPPPSSGT